MDSLSTSLIMTRNYKDLVILNPMYSSSKIKLNDALFKLIGLLNSTIIRGVSIAFTGLYVENHFSSQDLGSNSISSIKSLIFLENLELNNIKFENISVLDLSGFSSSAYLIFFGWGA